MAAVLVAEIIVDAADEWTENRIRVLPQNERVLHFFLALNLGAITVLISYLGWLSWVLLFLGASSAAWSVRDLIGMAPLRRRVRKSGSEP